MIICEIEVENACLLRLFAHGHAGRAQKGADIVCAAFSVLLRSLDLALSRHFLGLVETKADNEGEFFLEILSFPVAQKEWLTGVTDFLLGGLFSLQEEYPDYVKLNLKIREK